MILTNSEGVVTEYTLRFLFKATNNQSKYKALLARLKLARELGVKHLRVFTDSANNRSSQGEYEAQDSTMAKYLDRAHSNTAALQHFSISRIPRNENTQANMLSKMATSSDSFLGQAYIEYLKAPSINCAKRSNKSHKSRVE